MHQGYDHRHQQTTQSRNKYLPSRNEQIEPMEAPKKTDFVGCHKHLAHEKYNIKKKVGEGYGKKRERKKL